MTKELYENLNRAFVTDDPPTHAVAITEDEKVYLVARIYEHYYPTMPENQRNGGYRGTVIAELVDKGKYCVLNFVKTYRELGEAQTAFRKMASDLGMKYAGNARELKRLLKGIVVEERQTA